MLAGTSLGYAQITTFEQAASLSDSRALNENGIATKKVANNNFFFLFNDKSVTVTEDATVKVSYYFNDQLKAEMDVSTKVNGYEVIGIDLGFPDFGVMGGVSFNFNEMGVFMGESGTWKVKIGEGFLLSDGAKLPGYEFGGEFTAPAPVKSDYAYVITPDPTQPVEKLDKITIAYPEISNGDLITLMGTAEYSLVGPEGAEDFYLYPTLTENGEIVFEQGTADTVWPAGEYTFSVSKDAFALNRANVDPYNDEGNSDAIEVKFNVTGFTPAPRPSIAEYMTLLFPADSECNPVNTKSEAFPEGGMGYFEFGMKNADIALTSDMYPEWFSINYSETGEDGTFNYLCAVAPGDTQFVNIKDNEVAPLEEGETYAKTLTILFNTDEGWGYSADMYKNAGFYEVVIPDKSFFLNDEALQKASYVFHYDPNATGVANVAAGNEVYNIYSIDGRSIVRNGNKAAVDGLQKGLYIINGKKVLINK